MKEKRAWNIWIANDSRAEDQLDWKIKEDKDNLIINVKPIKKYSDTRKDSQKIN